MKIFINPGHCIGLDAGACGCGLEEARVAMDVAQKLQHYLSVIDAQVKVFQFDGLLEIVNESNMWGSDLFISIHCNACESHAARGTETYYSGSSESLRLACAIQRQIVNSIPTLNRGVQFANFFVTRLTDCPAVLIELAFIDNPNDARLLTDYQDEFARAIARAVTDYLGASY